MIRKITLLVIVASFTSAFSQNLSLSTKQISQLLVVVQQVIKTKVMISYM
ncbi:hypothetical protein BC748_0742 [Flavobacterium dankookense]|uniref:Uncharacterized protein n=1 Tax=Flavobacterium dankookense TaxID=706186 RepID=A0A4R6QHQ8_9FLAO|nr:hypothetical protein BC748_0742 [Flavobacterium dankookense]